MRAPDKEIQTLLFWLTLTTDRLRNKFPVGISLFYCLSGIKTSLGYVKENVLFFMFPRKLENLDPPKLSSYLWGEFSYPVDTWLVQPCQNRFLYISNFFPLSSASSLYSTSHACFLDFGGTKYMTTHPPSPKLDRSDPNIA